MVVLSDTREHYLMLSLIEVVIVVSASQGIHPIIHAEHLCLVQE